MSSDSAARRRAASLLGVSRFHLYWTMVLPPFGGGWSAWDDVVGDADFVHLESGGAAPCSRPRGNSR